MIHPTAIVHRGARLAPDVEVGPYSVIGEHVEVGEGSFIGSHVVLDGHTRIGQRNTIWHFVSIGAPPQDKKYKGEPTGVEVGDRNTIREFCTINRGTSQDAGVTRVGNDNWIMAYVHFAHDCQIGNNAIFANLAQDLPPYVTAAGNMARPFGINKEGLKRRGFSPEAIAGLKRAYKTLYRKGLTLEAALAELKAQAAACREVQPLLDFIARSKRGIIR